MSGGCSRGWLAFLCIVMASCVAYGILYLLTLNGLGAGETAPIWDAGLEPRVAASFVAFMALPAAILLAMGRLQLLEFKRVWLWPLAFYAAVAALALAFFPHNKEFFAGFDRDLASTDFALWSAFLAMQVMPVDFFTKRIVQRELTGLAGPVAGQAGQFAAWMLAHVFELFWLVPLWGVWGALAFIVGTGILSGCIYARGGSTGAFMLGHWLCNMAIAIVVSA